jgi:hypothetical protein
MADIWPVFEGREPTRGGPWLSLPLEEAIELLELKPRHFISDPNRTPRFGPQDRDLSLFGYKHVVVEVRDEESRPPDWKEGFYRSPVSPEDAFDRVLRHVVGPIIGEANVLRVEHVPSIDSKGRVTARVTIVLAPSALRHITGEISLQAVGRLQEQLAVMGSEGMPTLQYATEDELADNTQ